MKIGLLYEGDLDEKPLIAIVKRLVLKFKPSTQLAFFPNPAHGSIDNHIRRSVVLFFETFECDLAIFIADTDGKVIKKRRISGLVSRYCKEFAPLSLHVVAFPDPELEQWFLDEEDSIKKILNLLGNKQLPYSGMGSKERLQRIIKENNKDVTLNRNDIYTEIAETVNFGKLLMRSPSFKKFFNSLKKSVM